MKRSWLWVIVIFLGSLPVGGALQYYFTGNSERETSTRNWLAVGQAVLGIAIMAFGLFMQVRANRNPVEPDRDQTRLDLSD